MKTPTLREVLWSAQDRRCWLCETYMHKGERNHPMAATLDHLWPRKLYGKIGDIGLSLLAHRRCNEERGAVAPTDDEIRVLIATYRRIPAWWLEMNARDAAVNARQAQALAMRSEIVAEMARRAA